MKTHLLLCALLSVCFSVSYATVHTVQVENFQFVPATVNAVVGDSITWTWVSGSHTTTCDPATQSGNSLPAGAATWNVSINSGSPSFTYKLTVAGTYNYWCIPHSPNMAAVINVTGALPVTLLNFTVSVTQDNKALLTWTVAAEQNTDHYTIQKSMDGKTFSDIGNMAAGGTSSLQKTYTYTDNSTASTRYAYYALKMVDKDGKTALSPIVMFTNNGAKSGIVISMSPNPVSRPGHLMLQFVAEKPGNLTVQLYDAKGSKVKETKMAAVTGINNGHFHLGDLPSGVYSVGFFIDGKKEIRQLQVQ